MNYADIYNWFDNFAHDTFRNRFSKQYEERQLRAAKVNYKNWKPLSREQKKEITAYWGLKRHVESDFMTHEIMMNVKDDFNVRYCPERVFRTYLDPAFNDRRIAWAWVDKNYFERFQPELPLPYAYVRNVNGCFLDHDYHLISKDEAKRIIISNLPLLVKPSVLSGEGKNIRLISNEEEADEIFVQYDKDYLVQELVHQCDELKKMSLRSANSFRIVTAMVNGEPKQLTGHLLCNTTDSIAVNANAAPGTGVVLIKTDADGKLADVGYFENAKKIDILPFGFTFGGMQIPSYQKAVTLALNAHKSMPQFGFIGWDVTIDENYNPVFFEWNLGGIEIYHSQLTNGPLFGEYSDYFADIARRMINGSYK